MLRRRFSGNKAFLTASCRGAESLSNEERNRLYIVGTTVRNVMGFLLLSGMKGVARRSQTASTLKGNKNSMVEPAKRGVRRALRVPWM